jgi:hypothetical protein
MRTSTHLQGASQSGLRFDGIGMARSAATFLGAVFLGIGLVGVFSPGFMGAHLNPVHTAVHLISAAVSLWFGLAGSGRSVVTFCIVFAIFYGALGLAGFFFGVPDQHTLADVVHGADTRLLRVIPGSFELATPDHLIHVAIASIYLVAGLAGTAAVGQSDLHPL